MSLLITQSALQEESSTLKDVYSKSSIGQFVPNKGYRRNEAENVHLNHHFKRLKVFKTIIAGLILSYYGQKNLRITVKV